MDIFDWQKVDIVDAIVKIGVWIAALIVVVIAIKDGVRGSVESTMEGMEAIDFLEEQAIVLSEMEENFDRERIVLGTVCIIARDKGYRMVTPNIVRDCLTNEEALLVAQIASDVSFDGDTEEEVLSQMSNRDYLIKYYGMDNATALFGIANAHLKEWK